MTSKRSSLSFGAMSCVFSGVTSCLMMRMKMFLIPLLHVANVVVHVETIILMTMLMMALGTTGGIPVMMALQLLGIAQRSQMPLHLRGPVKGMRAHVLVPTACMATVRTMCRARSPQTMAGQMRTLTISADIVGPVTLPTQRMRMWRSTRSGRKLLVAVVKSGSRRERALLMRSDRRCRTALSVCGHRLV
ncbi:MAG: hypothetical protein Q4A93_07665 [Actinomycetota bacterium]|nr:hypothetical protein [Actinomycetota bacterium]